MVGIEQKLSLVLKNTVEVITPDELKKLLEEKKSPSVYVGIAPTGPFHMAYLVVLGKLFELQKAGFKTKILIANVHAAMDDLKAPWEQIMLRAEYYKKCIELSFPWKEKPEFIIGSEFQFGKDYLKDVLRASTITTVKRAMRAASEVCRLKNPKVSELIYPIMQALDEEYLNVDMQLGGLDQRHIFVFARELLPKLGYRQRVELMTPLVASLKGPGTKMSSSIPESHIKVYETPESIKEKIVKAYCPIAKEENPILQFYQFIIFPILEKVTILREEKFGGDVSFNSYEELEKEFLEKKIHPMDLKNTLALKLAEIFSDARKYFEKNADMLKNLGKEFLA
ncbi:MAG: tyrosine--tRNA ligase [Candidatus Iainarchaeum archaeon]|uniref:Tyrosine--tRNA ligase n=1 Tax=Candidatus Iainarchaeum sp. TaxID=3101447 RepID=A0A497JH49_9ARCH|nr:MAG: tyrosine--tRNA ligase [Candidatus Diapherotrites archaeon]